MFIEVSRGGSICEFSQIISLRVYASWYAFDYKTAQFSPAFVFLILFFAIFYLVSGVGLIFTIIAIPVQLDGNWVTLLWAGEAALLFWIGRTRAAPAFEGLAYGLFALAFFSLLND